MDKKNYITKQGADKLRDEYHQLFHVERPKLVETVAWAASNGDRSENADYIYGKRKLREIDRRIGQLQDKLEAAEVVDVTQVKNSHIVFGATVSLMDEDGETLQFMIVGEDEIDVDHHKISWKSPIAKALLGRKCGDVVVIKRPKGDLEVEILNVEYK